MCVSWLIKQTLSPNKPLRSLPYIYVCVCTHTHTPSIISVHFLKRNGTLASPCIPAESELDPLIVLNSWQRLSAAFAYVLETPSVGCGRFGASMPVMLVLFGVLRYPTYMPFAKRAVCVASH